MVKDLFSPVEEIKEKKKAIKISCADIEIAVANYFNPRVHLIVPNISWGMNLHECDLLIMNGSNYGVEVEIKISKTDLKKDLLKGHGHKSDRIRRLFFAIPEHLYTDEIIALIPERAGIFVIRPGEKISYLENAGKTKGIHYVKPKCLLMRNAKMNKYAKPFTDKERVVMGRLGMMRYWNLRNDNFITNFTTQ
jgi:hypothetical protein